MNVNPAPVATRMLSSRMDIFSKGAAPGAAVPFTAVFTVPSLAMRVEVEFELGSAVMAKVKGPDDLIAEGTGMVRGVMDRVAKAINGDSGLPTDVTTLQARVRELVDALAESKQKYDALFLHSVGASGE